MRRFPCWTEKLRTTVDCVLEERLRSCRLGFLRAFHNRISCWIACAGLALHECLVTFNWVCMYADLALREEAAFHGGLQVRRLGCVNLPLLRVIGISRAQAWIKMQLVFAVFHFGCVRTHTHTPWCCTTFFMPRSVAAWLCALGFAWPFRKVV